jgi:Amt family ammonium transporter
MARIGKPTSIGIVTGCVAGLATITPAAGYVGPIGAVAIGAAGGAVCFAATLYVKQVLRFDDSLDVFAVHGVGGMLGSILLSIFALEAFGGGGLPQGVGWTRQLGVQILAVGVTALWSGGVSFVLLHLLRGITGLRVSEEEEFEGLDLAAHGERAYDYT